MHQQSELNLNKTLLALTSHNTKGQKIWKINSTVEHTGNFTPQHKLQLDPCHLTISSLGSQPILQKFKLHNKCNSWRFDSRLPSKSFLMWNLKFHFSCKTNVLKILFFHQQIEHFFSQWSEIRKLIRSGIASVRGGWLEARKQPAWAHQAVVNRRFVEWLAITYKKWKRNEVKSLLCY